MSELLFTPIDTALFTYCGSISFFVTVQTINRHLFWMLFEENKTSEFPGLNFIHERDSVVDLRNLVLSGSNFAHKN